jgi:hypothetical protein
MSRRSSWTVFISERRLSRSFVIVTIFHKR